MITGYFARLPRALCPPPSNENGRATVVPWSISIASSTLPTLSILLSCPSRKPVAHPQRRRSILTTVLAFDIKTTPLQKPPSKLPRNLTSPNPDLGRRRFMRHSPPIPPPTSSYLTKPLRSSPLHLPRHTRLSHTSFQLLFHFYHRPWRSCGLRHISFSMRG